MALKVDDLSAANGGFMILENFSPKYKQTDLWKPKSNEASKKELFFIAINKPAPSLD